MRAGLRAIRNFMTQNLPGDMRARKILHGKHGTEEEFVSFRV